MSCALCGLESVATYCCAGCEAVHRILMARGEEENMVQNPLFIEAVRAGLISNPDVRVGGDRGATERYELTIDAMWCPSCADLVGMVVGQLDGVGCVHVDYATDMAVIEYSPMVVGKETINAKIKALGYEPLPLGSVRIDRSLLLRLGVAIFCALNLMMFSYPVYANLLSADPERLTHLFSWLSFVVVLPVLVYSASPIFRRWFKGMRAGKLGMEALVGMGVLAGFFLSCYNLWRGSGEVYFDSIALIITFVLVGKLIENRAKYSVRATLDRLARSLPKRARRLSGEFVLLKELKRGDLVVSLPGEAMVVDGEVVEGQGVVDEAVVTGEAKPVSKMVGDRVIGGSVITSGRLVVQVGDGSSLAAIVELVGSHLARGKTEHRAVDQLSHWFVPFVIVLATILGIFFGPIRAISVLLIACPCAIGIAVPLAESLLIIALAKAGAIVRNRAVLTSLGKEKIYFFDKTGTVTEGKFKVLSGEVTPAIRGLASLSTHPVAVAVAATTGEKIVPSDYQEIVGRGMQATGLLLGSARFMREHGYQVEEFEETTVYYVDGGPPVAIRLGDQIKRLPLSDLAPTPSVLLSGDGNKAVARVAILCQFTKWYGEKSPLEKSDIISNCKSVTCMVGDGINDAPALAAATIGVAPLSATDMSKQVADILISDLEVLPRLRQLGLRGRRVARQNLFWAFAYNGLGIPLAATGLLHPLMAASAMVLSSLCVILNSLRISRIKLKMTPSSDFNNKMISSVVE